MDDKSTNQLDKTQPEEQRHIRKSRREHKWYSRENILFTAGLLLIAATFITAEEGRPFHYEFLILGAALCGVGVTQWRDKI